MGFAKQHYGYPHVMVLPLGASEMCSENGRFGCLRDEDEGANVVDSE